MAESTQEAFEGESREYIRQASEYEQERTKYVWKASDYRAQIKENLKHNRQTNDRRLVIDECLQATGQK